MDGLDPTVIFDESFDQYGRPQMPVPDFALAQAHQTPSMMSTDHSEIDDQSRGAAPAMSEARPRRLKHGSSEHIKHRRTRSGCYTCRHRRVKCDETRPICERCRKGKRDCAYPHQNSSSSTASRGDRRGKNASVGSESSRSADDLDLDAVESLSKTTGDREWAADEDMNSLSAASDGHPSPEAHPSDGKSTLPTYQKPDPPNKRASGPTPTQSRSDSSSPPQIDYGRKRASLPRQVKFYLNVHQRSLSYHHYSFKSDARNFLKTTFLEIAVDYEPLLYAVVAFAAYNYALDRPEGRARHFLDYYDRSVSLFRRSLAKSDRPTLATLLTMLQLATIEEFLGDWVNLLSHQKAAYQIITELYNPQTIMQGETQRKVLDWYVHFDLSAGMMAGGATVLGREWMTECAGFYARKARDSPNETVAKVDEYFSAIRLLATDVALLFASKATRSISDDAFHVSADELLSQVDALGSLIESTFNDPSFFVKKWRRKPREETDITDYTDPLFTYSGEYSPMNHVLTDLWAVSLIFRYQVSMARSSQQGPPGQGGGGAHDPPPELRRLAFKMCKIFEAIEHGDDGDAGAVLGCQASLGIASIFLPRDGRHVGWCRRKFALVERSGYIYPPSLRRRMTDLWGQDVTHWWLPDGEGCPPVVRSMRDFIDFRARSAQRPPDARDADVRDINGVFRSMRLEGREDLLEELGTA